MMSAETAAYIMMSGGGQTNRNAVFHDILENKQVIYTGDMTGGYTCDIAVWSPPLDEENGYPQIYEGGYFGTWFYLRKYENAEQKEYFAQWMSLVQYNSYRVAIVYKNNTPLYATIMRSIPGVEKGDFDNVPVNTATGSDEFAVQRSGNYSIDNVSLTTFNTFEPWFDTSGTTKRGFVGAFKINLAYQIEYSYDKYKLIEESQYNWKAVKDGSRISQTYSETINSSYDKSLMPTYYGTFTDMTYGQLHDALLDMAYAISAANGVNVTPITIILPEAVQ